MFECNKCKSRAKNYNRFMESHKDTKTQSFMKKARIFK